MVEGFNYVHHHLVTFFILQESSYTKNCYHKFTIFQFVVQFEKFKIKNKMKVQEKVLFLESLLLIDYLKNKQCPPVVVINEIQ